MECPSDRIPNTKLPACCEQEKVKHNNVAAGAQRTQVAGAALTRMLDFLIALARQCPQTGRPTDI
eukprot:9480540-Pyramimonas_sp.AAC.1